MTTLEHRAVSEAPEFRAKGQKLVASGVAMKYGAKSKPIRGQFREVFAPGAFAATLGAGDIASHNEHTGPYLARTGAGTLRLMDSRSELAYEIDLPDTTAGRDTAVLLERGDIKGSSIGFRTSAKHEKWSVDAHGMAMRSISGATLSRVDLTVAPYYDESTAELALRSLADQTGLQLRSVVEAAKQGKLAGLLGHRASSRGGADVRAWVRAEVGRPCSMTSVRRPAHWFA